MKVLYHRTLRQAGGEVWVLRGGKISFLLRHAENTKHEIEALVGEAYIRRTVEVETLEWESNYNLGVYV